MCVEMKEGAANEVARMLVVLCCVFRNARFREGVECASEMVVIGDGALLYCTVAHVNDNKPCHSTETEMTALQAEMTGIKDSMAEAREKLMAQVKYAHVYAHVCSRTLTYAHVC